MSKPKAKKAKPGKKHWTEEQNARWSQLAGNPKLPTPEYEYTLRDTQPDQEMGWLVLIDNGDPEWCAYQARAEIVANQALLDAKNEGYTISVHLLKCLKQNGEAP